LNIDESLLKKSEEEYGENYHAHYLEIYKLYVEMADRISARRQTANSFFLTINTAIIALLGYVQFGAYLGEKMGIESSPIDEFYWIISTLGMILCVLWYLLVRSYKELNTAKFIVIQHIEKNLPLAPYEAEWEALGRGHTHRLYKPFTHIEMWIPWVFFVLNLVNLAAFLKVSLGL
jgi:hypothetical protein